MSKRVREHSEPVWDLRITSEANVLYAAAVILLLSLALVWPLAERYEIALHLMWRIVSLAAGCTLVFLLWRIWQQDQLRAKHTYEEWQEQPDREVWIKDGSSLKRASSSISPEVIDKLEQVMLTKEMQIGSIYVARDDLERAWRDAKRETYPHDRWRDDQSELEQLGIIDESGDWMGAS